MWNYDKPTSKKSRTEIELTETFDYVHELELKLKKIEAVVDSLYFKELIINGLLKTNNETSKDVNKMPNHQTAEREP